MKRLACLVGVCCALSFGCGGDVISNIDAGHDGGRIDGGGGSGDGGGGGVDGGHPTPECTPTGGECDDGNPCNGDESCGTDLTCTAGAPLDDGTLCDADGNTDTRDVCVGGACGASRCGDGFVDDTLGEVCDDANDVNGDGCDACQFSCESNPDCDDGESCNGVETCGADHACAGGTPAGDGDACTQASGAAGRCLGGACVPPACTADDMCDDLDMCNGREICSPASGMCVTGTPPNCDDSNACTMDGCVSRTGACTHTLIDADSDGHAASALGACGDDCDDTNPTVFPGARDVCDGLDNDCDGMTDEDGVSTWYADCDADAFAAVGARTLMSCAMPAPGAAGCTVGGGWTVTDPARSADCVDTNATVNPAQTMFQTTAIPGVPAASDFDYDCDGTEEQQFTDVAECTAILGGPGVPPLCILARAGWVPGAIGGRVPACGVAGDFATGRGGCTAVATRCVPTGTERRTQGCL